MVTLAVAAVLMTVAMPDFATFLKNNRLSSTASDFVGSISRMRTEALRRRATVIMCRSTNALSASPTCGGSNNVWTTGYIMYATDGDVNERSYDSSTDTLLLARGPQPANVRIISDSSGNNWLTINPDASLREGAPAAYAVCDDRNEAAGRLIQINMTGRARVTATVPGDTDNDCTPT